MVMLTSLLNCVPRSLNRIRLLCKVRKYEEILYFISTSRSVKYQMTKGTFCLLKLAGVDRQKGLWVCAGFRDLFRCNTFRHLIIGAVYMDARLACLTS